MATSDTIRALAISLRVLEPHATAELQQLAALDQSLYDDAHSHFVLFGEYLAGMLNSFYGVINDRDLTKFDHLIARVSAPSRVPYKGDALFFTSGFQQRYGDDLPHLSSSFTVMELLHRELTAFVKTYGS